MQLLICVLFQVVEVSAKCEMMSELVTRFQQLQSRLSSVTTEVEEVHKPHRITQIIIMYVALLSNDRIDVVIFG